MGWLNGNLAPDDPTQDGPRLLNVPGQLGLQARNKAQIQRLDLARQLEQHPALDGPLRHQPCQIGLRKRQPLRNRFRGAQRTRGNGVCEVPNLRTQFRDPPAFDFATGLDAIALATRLRSSAITSASTRSIFHPLKQPCLHKGEPHGEPVTAYSVPPSLRDAHP